GGQFAAPPDAGITSVPSTLGSLAGSAIGSPRESTPLDQFKSMNGCVTIFLPLVRSRTKKYPLREAIATSLRFCLLISPSMSTGVSTLSQSCVSCGDAWNPQTNFPVSGFNATVEHVHRLSPLRPCAACTG